MTRVPAQSSRKKHGDCELCRRQTLLTFHHLIPKKMHRRKHFQKMYRRATLNAGINICRQCHDGLHRLYDEMTLATRLNSLESLIEDTAVSRHVRWVARQKTPRGPL